MRQFGLQRELASSLLVAVSAGVLACVVARQVCAGAQHSGGRLWRRAGSVALLLPGLLGGLVLGLCIMVTIQAPLLSWLRHTPLPLIVAAALVIMPIALLMQLLLQRRGAATDRHVARLLAASPLRRLSSDAASIDWVRRRHPLFCAGALLICQLF